MVPRLRGRSSDLGRRLAGSRGRPGSSSRRRRRAGAGVGRDNHPAREGDKPQRNTPHPEPPTRTRTTPTHQHRKDGCRPDQTASQASADVPQLREQIRRACAEADGFRYETLEPWDYQTHPDALLAVRDREMERMKLLVAASESPGHAVRLAAQYADKAIENGERAERLEERLRLVTDEKVAHVVGPNIELLCEEIGRLKEEVAGARHVGAEMRNFCSPHGVAADYADRLVEAMDRAKEER